jgi:ATP-binding cassette subfamily C protein CydD
MSQPPTSQLSGTQFLSERGPAAAPYSLFAATATALDAVCAVAFVWTLTRVLVSSTGNRKEFAVSIALLCLLSAARGALAWAALAWGSAGAARVKRAVRRDVLQVALLALAGERLIGEASTAVVEEIEALDGYFVRYRPAKLAVLFAPCIVLTAAAEASPVAAAILLAALIPLILLLAVSGNAAAAASGRQLEALSRLAGLFVDRIRALPMLLAFQAERAETERVGTAAADLSRRTLAVLKIAFISTAGLEFFAALSVALVAVYAGFKLLGLLPFQTAEVLSFERSFFVLALVPEFFGPLRRLAAAYHDKQLAEAAALRLMRFLASPQAPAAAHSPLAAPPRIQFSAVEVRFADEPDLTIGPLDLIVPPNTITALLGPTGAGKTTVLRLLIGEVPLTSGEVFVDSDRLSAAGSFAASIAWAGQSPVIVPGSIADNIALGRTDATPAEIADVAERAGLSSSLGARPGGLSAQLDERGSGLSGGERRRIGLARALLKNAPILLLDEPTSDLDAIAEEQMIQLIAAAARGRTVLMATHSERLAAIADQRVLL